MRVQISLFLAIVGTSLVASPAWAEPTLIYLPPETAEESLNNEILQTLTSIKRPAKRSALKIDELMLAVECTAKTVGCLQKIGQNLGAAGLVMGELQTTEKEPRLTLRWFDVKSGGDAGRVELLLPPDPERRIKALQKSARTLFGIALPVSDLTGGLKVTANVPYVEILLDGQPRGTVPLELRNLPAKRYQIEARLSNYSNWKGEVEVKADQMTRLEIEMEASGEIPESDHAPSYLESIRTRTWLVAGLGAGCLVGAIAFGAHMNSQQNEIDKLTGNTFEEIAKMEDLKDSGERDALVANILFGIGGAMVATAAVMSYLDYRRSRHPSPTKVDVGVGPGSILVRGTF